MENNNKENQFGGAKRPRIFSGLLLLAAGFLLLGYKMGAPIPSWLFTWPMILITIGLFTGLKSRFHNPGSFIMIAIGTIFLIDEIVPVHNFHEYIIPAILISIGFIYIFKPRHGWDDSYKKKWHDVNYFERPVVTPVMENYSETKNDNTEGERSEYVELNAIFGGVKKIILSKNFKGGEINSFMGGTELNLLKADIQSPIVLEVNNVFGGSKIIVPSNWDVKNEVTAVFGGIEDKRSITSAMPDPDKVMTLKGTCVFGGIEVNNF